MMEIQSPALFPNIAKTAPAPSQAAAPLKLGAILEVIVQARLGENRFQLHLLPEGTSLISLSNGELAIGQRLQVEVSRLGALPELRILHTDTPSPDIVPKALRELLPKQIDLKELSSMFRLLPDLKSQNLPDSVRMALIRLAEALPRAEKLTTPEGVQKFVQNSGLFLEASLAAVMTDGAALPENDLKARLLNLLAALQDSDAGKAVGPSKSLQQKSIPQTARNASNLSVNENQDDFSDEDPLNLEKLAQKVQGALAKITVDQLASLPRDNGAISLQLTLPFAEGCNQDNAKLIIASEGRTTTHGERVCPSWTVTIELLPPGMGSFNARMVWNGEHIDACLWSDQEETSVLMSSASETLRARLEQAGVEAGAITVLERPPPSLATRGDTPPLLDLHA